MTSSRVQVAGGPGDFMTVHHLTVTGSQAEIGRALAEEARRAYGWRPVPAPGAVLARARRAWFERHWPQQAARTAAVAELTGAHPDAYLVDALTGVPDGSACSVAWCPPSVSTDGRGRLGRNYDFFTVGWGELFAMLGSGIEPPPAERPMAARPYVVTTVPDDGLATTVLTMDMLDGCTEGINAAGLTVALLIADAGSVGLPDARPQVGLNSLQLPRFVLETCRTAEEARYALLGAKQYDGGMPLHYVIADPSGDGFVWERSHQGVEHIIESAGALCSTNHMLHAHPDPGALPEDTAETMATYRRMRTISARVAGRVSEAGLREALDEVAFDANEAAGMPLRTLWQSLFDTEDRSMSTRFYLGDEADGSSRFSKELIFRPEA